MEQDFTIHFHKVRQIWFAYRNSSFHVSDFHNYKREKWGAEDLCIFSTASSFILSLIHSYHNHNAKISFHHFNKLNLRYIHTYIYRWHDRTVDCWLWFSDGVQNWWEITRKKENPEEIDLELETQTLISCNKENKKKKKKMDEIPGSVGTTASFSLRLGQTMFSSASLLSMSLGEFYSYSAFWYITLLLFFSYYSLISLPSLLYLENGIFLLHTNSAILS